VNIVGCSGMLRGMGKNRRQKSVTLVGAGSLAQALAKLLPKAEYTIDEIVIRPDSSREKSGMRIARSSHAHLATVNDAAWSSEIVWLAISDSAIRECARSLSRLANWKGKVVLHSSGALSSKELETLKRRGAFVASAHPMMTFVPGQAPKMSNVVWTVEGDPRATSAVREMVAALGGLSLTIEKKQKALYHAFAAFLSPLLLVYLEAAAELGLASGIARRDLAPLMRPIMEQTLHNAFANLGKKGELGKAFSGPLIRGDVATIQRHLRALKSSPNAKGLYETLVLTALGGSLPINNRLAIRRTIERKK
jgi:predicted short-subunit dehydrogenase-like oxidoreductase (DUF2520 family)